MALERSPHVAFLFVLALLLSATPSLAEPASVFALAGELSVAGPATVMVNDSPAIPADANVTAAVPPALDAAMPTNDSPAVKPDVVIMPEEPANVSPGAAGAPAPGEPSPLVVMGTVYATSGEDRRPWADGHIQVYVNGVPAALDGATYWAAVAPSRDIEVTLLHDCGYLLGRSTGTADESGGITSLDVEAPALDVSGDVYDGDQPADGARLLIYVNDRQYGPVYARSGEGPMFSLLLPGGHPGDHVSIAASRGDSAGIVCQDVSDYHVFLTVNLKSTATYLPDPAPAALPTPAEKLEKLRLRPIPRQILNSERV